MDNSFLTFTSAFRYYREVRNQELQFSLLKSNVVPLKTTSYSLDNWIGITDVLHELSNEKIDVAVASKVHVYPSSHFKFHIYSGKYPKGSFYRLNETIYIACPELMFCQLASTYSFEKLLLLGYEICGTYSYNDHSPIGFSNNLCPLTNVHNISNYISELKKCSYNFSGLKNAKKAVDYILENSASPQESRLSILLTGPRSIGAFGLKNCSLNSKVKLTSKAAQICNQTFVFPDICIKDKKIAIEYDSDYFHDNENQNRKDKRRINALHYDGWKTYTFVADQFYNYGAVKNLAIDILKSSGQSSRIRVKDFDSKFYKLMDYLYKNY